METRYGQLEEKTSKMRNWNVEISVQNAEKRKHVNLVSRLALSKSRLSKRCLSEPSDSVMVAIEMRHAFMLTTSKRAVTVY